MKEMTVDIAALARAYDPEAFSDHATDPGLRSAAVVQWAARRYMALEAANRVAFSSWLTERDALTAHKVASEAARIAETADPIEVALSGPAYVASAIRAAFPAPTTPEGQTE